jgi:tRNA(Ile)-lysidine synthase TilS/MesJ
LADSEKLIRCNRCILPHTFPGANIDETGTCQLCREAIPLENVEAKREELRLAMKASLAEPNPKGEFDVLVAYSGGKDSSYILWLLSQHYGQRCLAITIDNGFISERAFENGRRVTETLGIDYHIVRPSPSFVKTAFRKSLTESVHPKVALKRASSVCNTCISMINNHMVKTAIQWDIPIIAGGYISGQVPKNSAVLNYDPAARQKGRMRTVNEMIKHFGPEAQHYYGIADQLAKGAGELVILNPMLTLAYNEDEILAKISELGWEMPSDTGANSSNCQLNDLGIAAHVKQHRFNPYVNELAELVRNGLMPRHEALKKVEAVPNFSELKTQMNKLDLKPEDM